MTVLDDMIQMNSILQRQPKSSLPIKKSGVSGLEGPPTTKFQVSNTPDEIKFITLLRMVPPFRNHFYLLFAFFIVQTWTACTGATPYSYNSNCYPQCPWNSTLVTYLTTSNTCVTSCPSGSFADDSTKTCASSCPSSPIQTYKDTVYNRCVSQCSTNPSYFAYNVTNTCVQYCPSPYWAYEDYQFCTPDCPLNTYYQIDGSQRTCVKICYPNYYAHINRSCVASTSCPSSPVAYFGDDSTGKCVEVCPAAKGTFGENSTRKCVIYCPLGSFADPTTQICVATCPQVPYYYGSNITRNCILTCNEGEFADNTTKQCVLKCPNGYFGDYYTRSCVKTCPIIRQTYGDSLTNLCVPICPANFFADNNTRTCQAAINCTNQTFGDPVTQKCVSAQGCSPGFYVDASLGLCVVRCSTWGNPLTMFCEPTCPWNPPVFSYYKDTSTNLCVKQCPKAPRTFGDNSTKACVSKCPNGSLGNPVNMVCQLTCPSGFFADNSLNLCVATCTQNTTVVLYFFSLNLTCGTSCPQGYFADNATLTCQMQCTNNTYGYDPNNTCLSVCPEGYFADNYTLTCVQSCPIQNGQYADPSTNLCVDMCPQNPDLYGQNINNGNKTCVSACSITGFFADPLTRTCVPQCDTSFGLYGYPLDWRCYQLCPTGYGNPLNSQCVDVCPRFPKFFYGDNLTKTCVLSCPNQTYGDRKSNLCVNATDCSPGTFADDASGVCVPVCSALLNLFGDPLNGKCVKVCSFPLYADRLTRKCEVDCGSSGSRYMQNATRSCVSLCSSIPDTYGDPNTNSCEYNCTNGYFALANTTRRVCVSMCPSTPAYLADLDNFMCVLTCANQTYQFINNTFRGCLRVCPPQIYSNGAISVDLYADNTTWKCVQVCPYGFYAFKHPSDTNIRQCVRICPMVGSTYYFAQDKSRTCVTTCPMMFYGTYGDRITFKCVSTCSRLQYRDNSTRLCVYQCQPGFFANNVTWNCSAWCNSGYFAESINRTCVKNCPFGYYGHNLQCVSRCPNNTLYYNDNTTWLCVTRCPAYPDYFADNSTQSCVFRCPSNTYADIATRTCLPALNCSDTTIADPITGRCTLKCTKVPMYYLTPETNTCGPTCSNNTFALNQTNMCVDECPAPYYGVNSTSHFYCTQYCPPNEYMWINITTRMCIPYCPEGLFRDVLTMTCVSVCSDYYYANSSNLECVTSCAPLYADDDTKTCVSVCPSGKTASNHSFKCQDYCDYGQFSLNKVCITDCPQPYFADNLTRKCINDCPGDPLTFADTANRRCVLKCNATQYAFMDNLTCLSVCPQGYYRQLTLRLCLSYCPQGYFADNLTLNCMISCAASAYPFADPTTQTCVAKCPHDPDLYGYNNQCVTQCPLGYYAQNFTRTCVNVCPNVSSTYTNASWADSLTRRCLRRCSALSYAFKNSSDNVCLNVCPVGTWASIAQQACVVVCPNGTFAHNSSTTCVDQCPPGLYADLVNRICMPDCSYNTSLYADNSSDSCVASCPNFPDLYADPTTQQCVLSCPSGWYAYNQTRQCVTDCPAPYYADPSGLLCVRSCPVQTLTFADDKIRKCMPSCSNYSQTINSTVVQVNFYADNTSLKCVRQCPEVPNRFYGSNETNQCLQTCPSGTYGDNDTRVCLDKCVFQYPKFTWMDRTNNFCVKVCPYGYYADNKTGYCQTNCTIGTFADDSTRRCIYNCPIIPTSYSILINGTGKCVYNCPAGTYSSEVSISCVTTCPTQPSIYYTYPPTNACVKQCIYPYYADTQALACTLDCKVGYYGNLTTKTCEICQVQCVTCTGYLVCTSCITGFYLYQITCVVSCPSYPVLYFAHKQSGVCFVTCPAPFFGQPSTKVCQLTCPSLTYPSLTTRICTPCPTGCRTCDANGCYTCFSNYTFLLSALTCNKNCNNTAKYYFNSKCFTTCPAGSYLSYDLVNCLACSSPCATCVGTSGNCTSCIGSYYYLGKCLNACPDNFYIGNNLNCQPCSSNPTKCTLPPLSYTIYPFTKDYKLNAYVVFNRPVNLSIAQFTATVQINYGGKPVKSNQYTATVQNSTTFRCIFTGLGGSLNQNSLSFYFPPGSIADQYGNILTTATVQSTVAITTGVNEQVLSISSPVTSSTQIITYFLLALLGLFFVKSGYPALITIQILQLIYMHIFLYTDPLPYVQYNFLNVLRYFHLTFLPSLFPSLGLTNSTYSLFSSDLSYLSNSPCILLFSLIIGGYLLVGFLSSKRFIKNKSIRKLFKSIRKNRMKYSIIHDAFWVCYIYATYISMLQFKMGSFNGTSNILNMVLAIITLIMFLAFTYFVFKMGYKYRKEPEKIPKKYSFLMLEPSASPLEMPMRYARKLIFCLGLLLTSVQTQGLVLLSSNLLFLAFYACYRPAKAPLTNVICIILQIGLILLISLFIAYDKLQTKDIDSQLGFSIAMIVVQAIVIIIVLLWSFYRLVLVIKQTETWKAIYNKCTQNTDPEYLKEQQRKRDLQFDFGSLQNRSQQERTDHPIEKFTSKSIDQKFNIFDQEDREEDVHQHFDLEKLEKQMSKKKPSRPGSVDSNEAIILKSQTSKNQSIFEPNKSAQNYRRRKHLQVVQNSGDNTIQEIHISQKNQKPDKEVKEGEKNLIENKASKRVLWEELDIDDDDY